VQTGRLTDATLRAMSDERWQPQRGEGSEPAPSWLASGAPARPSPVRHWLPWLVAALFVLSAAVLAGFGVAYLVASMQAVPVPPAALLPTASPTAAPTPTTRSTPSPAVSASARPSPTAAASATPTLSPSLGAQPLVHTVSRGESLSFIADQYGVSLDEIIELNGLQNPNLIVPGQQLLIPASATRTPGG
jgi:LysM repeat protein